jgi:5'-deoxynucleotidase YfbR-like HD superfamily hydrolase
MALVHDLAESIVGDITPHDRVSDQDKHEREKVDAHEKLERAGTALSVWADGHDIHLRACSWRCIECRRAVCALGRVRARRVCRGASRAVHRASSHCAHRFEQARVVKQMDKLDMIVQAWEYEQGVSL